MKNQPTLELPAVFFEHEGSDGTDAVAYVLDADVICLEAVEGGGEVRLLMHELEALYHFAQAEVERQEALDDFA